eukprot:SAG11_NODE_28442_length_321_cov_1.387387_1_plen_50_part_10
MADLTLRLTWPIVMAPAAPFVVRPEHQPIKSDVLIPVQLGPDNVNQVLVP